VGAGVIVAGADGEVVGVGDGVGLGMGVGMGATVEKITNDVDVPAANVVARKAPGMLRPPLAAAGPLMSVHPLVAS